MRGSYYVYYPLDFTRYGQGAQPSRPSTIDLILSNSTLNMSSIETHPGLLNSDHVPISCKIYGSVIKKNFLVPLYNSANWNLISNWVDSQIRELETEDISETSIESVINNLTRVLKEASTKIPLGKKCAWQRNLSQLSLYLIGQRNRFKRKLQRCYQPSERQRIICILKQLNILINQNVSKDRNNSWNSFLQSLPKGKQKFWKITKAIKGNAAGVASLTVNTQVIDESSQKANIIADVFERHHNLSNNLVSPSEHEVNNHLRWIDMQPIVNITDDLTTMEEVKFFTKTIKNKKAPGKDGIKSTIVKKMPDSFFNFLTKIFNWCLKNGYFPKLFKEAIVIPILKSGKDKKLPESYRPISMLSVLDKIFEKIILCRLKEHTESHNIISDDQFGFRSEHSTVHQIKRVVKLINNNKTSRKSTGIIFLDIEKAFDSIWHDGLIFKLNEFNYPIYLQKIIRSFLSERTFEVKVDDATSTLRNIPAGVPQGSVLSPTLYSIFISDFRPIRNQLAAFYADDSAIIAHGKVSNAIVKQMNRGLLNCQKYFERWKIKINNNKTQAILFPYNKSPKRLPNIPVSIDGNTISLQDTIKYLGITLDKKLTFRQHILQTCEKALKCGRALFPLLSRKSKLNVENKLLLYKMCIRPIMTYGCQIWYHRSAKTYLNKLQIIQNKNLKMVFDLPRRFSTNRLHRKYKQKMLREVCSDLTIRFEDKCRSSSFATIRNLVN